MRRVGPPPRRVCGRFGARRPSHQDHRRRRFQSAILRVGQSVPVRAPFAAVFVAWEGQQQAERWLGDAHLGEVASAEYAEALDEVRRHGYSVTINRDEHLLDRFAELTGTGPTPDKELSIDLVFQALVGSHHLPSHIEEGASLRVSLMSAPVFDPAGSVVASLMVLGSGALMTSSDIESLGGALLGSADATTGAIGGRRRSFDSADDARSA
jgi:DNA-binding IclR family transcriptional regulator